MSWSAHPDAPRPDEAHSPLGAPLVVGIGALCDLVAEEDHGRIARFSVEEFVVLDDHSTVVLDKRGFTVESNAQVPAMTAAELTRQVLNVVLPDDDASSESHPWSWLAELAARRGIAVSPAQLRSLDYEVRMGERLARWLTPDRH
jgi:hypothetical protein